MVLKVHLINLLLLLGAVHVFGDEYEDNVKFVLYNNGQKSISRFNETISEQGCDVNGKFSLIIHGWMGSDSPWILDLVSNLTQYRTGCIIFMNYSHYWHQKPPVGLRDGKGGEGGVLFFHQNHRGSEQSGVGAVGHEATNISGFLGENGEGEKS